MFRNSTVICVAFQREVCARVDSQPLAQFPDEFLEVVNDLDPGRNSENVDKHDASKNECDDFVEGLHGDSPRQNSENGDTHGASEYEDEAIHVIPVDEASAQVGESNYKLSAVLNSLRLLGLNQFITIPGNGAIIIGR